MKSFNALLEKYVESLRVAKTLLSEGGVILSESEIYEYLVDALDLEPSENLILMEIPSETIASLVSERYQLRPPPEIISEVSFPDGILPSGIPLFLTHQQVKIKGEIWVIHKNDVDPFPSNPHAHNYQHNLVIHLGNGIIYKKRKNVGKLTKKKFMLLRDSIKNVQLPNIEA